MVFVKIRNTFITGIAVIFPAVITFLLIRLLVININRWILNPFMKIMTPYMTAPYHMYIAKIGVFVFVIAIVCAIGWAANIIVLRKFFGIWEKIFLKVPMFGKIYYATKQISTAFLGQGKTIFKKVVLVEYPRKGLYSIGFITGEGKGDIERITGEGIFNVFIPTTPNPTSGVFLLVPKQELKFLKMTVAEGMKLVVSGGAVAPPFETAS